MTRPIATGAAQESPDVNYPEGVRVSTEGLGKQFRDPEGKWLTVLEDINVQVEAGEFLAVVGPSGCGKTTLLRIIQGLETLTSGHLHVGDSDDEVRVGFVFQKPSLLPWKTVRDNVAFPLALDAASGLFHTQAERDAYTDELLVMTGLQDFATYYPYQISGGMQQRVNLARALSIRPRLLLMDEPFSALDMQTRERMQRWVANLVEQVTTTVVFITHDLREAAFLGDRVLVLSSNPGRVAGSIEVAVGRPRDIHYQHGDELTALTREIWGMFPQE